MAKNNKAKLPQHTKLKQLFQYGKVRIVAIAGNRNTGKTNNIIALIHDYRQKNNNTPIYCYGLQSTVMQYVNKNYQCIEISSLLQLVTKKNCIVVIDECQRLHLNDRRYKVMLTEFVNYVYHNNVYCLLCTPSIREYNSVLGSIIEQWVLKSCHKSQCVNGSQLKKVIDEYKGQHKTIDYIDIPYDKLLIINDDCEQLLTLDYIKQVDNKADNISIL